MTGRHPAEDGSEPGTLVDKHPHVTFLCGQIEGLAHRDHGVVDLANRAAHVGRQQGELEAPSRLHEVLGISRSYVRVLPPRDVPTDALWLSTSTTMATGRNRPLATVEKHEWSRLGVYQSSPVRASQEMDAVRSTERLGP